MVKKAKRRFHKLHINFISLVDKGANLKTVIYRDGDAGPVLRGGSNSPDSAQRKVLHRAKGRRGCRISDDSRLG